MTGVEVEKETLKSRKERLAITNQSETEDVESDIKTEHGSALNTTKYEEPKSTIF